MTHTERQGPHLNPFPTPSPPPLTFLYFWGYNLITHPLQPAITLPGILTLCIRYRTRRRSLRCSEFEPRYYYMDTSAESSTTSARARAPPRSRTYRPFSSLGCNWFVGVGGPLDAMMRGSTGSGSRCTPAIEVDDGLFGVPSSAHFPHCPSTPNSSYSSETGTSTSGRDSENSSVVIL